MPGKDPKDFDLDEVCVWLNAIGLGSKTDAFRENAVDGNMLVTLTDEDMTELGLSGLQGKKVTRMVDATRDMANESGGGGGDAAAAKIQALEKENADLKNEVAALRMQLQELQSARAAPAPAPKPAPAPSHHHHHQPAGAPVIRGAAGGAARGAVLGAVAGTFKIVLFCMTRSILSCALPFSVFLPNTQVPLQEVSLI